MATGTGAAHERDTMLVIRGGEFTMGTDSLDSIAADGEGPARRVIVDDFRIAATVLTNRQFRRFVGAGKYITDAERAGASFVFHLQISEALRPSCPTRSRTALVAADRCAADRSFATTPTATAIGWRRKQAILPTALRAIAAFERQLTALEDGCIYAMIAPDHQVHHAEERNAMPAINRQIQLAAIPREKLGPEHFKLAQGPMPQAAPGELLLRVLMISLDAANRAWMQGATYRSALESGQVMAGGALAEVIESQAQGFAPGDLVFADTGWQEFAAVPATRARKLQRREPLTHLLSVYGVAGLTAYFGLLRVGQPKPGETVVVSAAAGAVGAFVGQIAKIQGCRVVGIAGSASKCAWLKSELGFDAERQTALDDLEAWVRDGRLKVPEDVIEGIENTPAALIGLLAGENIGKRMVRLDTRAARQAN